MDLGFGPGERLGVFIIVLDEGVTAPAPDVRLICIAAGPYILAFNRHSFAPDHTAQKVSPQSPLRRAILNCAAPLSKCR